MAKLDAATEKRILEAVDQGFEEQIGFLQELIRKPSLRGQEQTAQDFLHDAYKARGYALDRWAIELDSIRYHPGFSPVTIDYAGAFNVVATHRPREETGRSLILNGHVDVVPTGPHEMWQNPPFEPKREGDWLYGRGSGDMKAGLSANLYALDALRRLGWQPAGRVHLQSVVEEECTGNGALACLARGYEADAAIIPEPEDDRLVRANVGVLWFKVTVRGVPVHVREAGKGANAIEAAYRLIQALRGLEEEWNARKGAHRHFEALDHPINFNVGKIAGGDWASSVPAWCSFDARIALYPGVRAAEAAAEIEACLRQASRADSFLANNPPEVAWNGFFAEGYVLEEGSEAESTLGRAHLASYASSLESFVTTSYLDARVFVLYGDTPCLVYGPYSDNIHGFDERVSLASLKRVTGTIALFVAEWCGLEAVEAAGA
ncbi:acetylornithine deacetylase [Tistlia consotensis]|uniref:Acetylornithine deacetylase n=1 Tax=Tistlia consotensis USBA 355 TaxID=560819 RepID=A0A1Y6B7A5_9PROT|nr:ArgE/DapE family deacylase [Tistlia consotensis]SME88951.1 acetylornithine deacetylase [Tistlia consotensis USBA 355]SNR25509.1 acetylornithine deacetylase [Tistlia consotensis]